MKEGTSHGFPENIMKEKNGEHPFGDAGQLILLCLFFVVWVSDTFFLHWSTFLSVLIPRYLRMVFLVLALLSTFLLVRSAHFVVSQKERPNHVVETGAFHYVRHPLYLGSLLAYLGVAISSMSLFSLALLIPVFVFYNYIATYEEKLLEEKFGTTYQDYKKRTGKWLPKISLSEYASRR